MISKRDWMFIAFANAVSMAIAIPAALFHWGWLAATISAVVELALLAYFCLRHSEPLFVRLFVFGLAAGLVELLNDTWLIAGRGVLVYDPGGPFIIDTPLYMPFTWALIFVTDGAVAWWLWQKFGPLKAALAMAAISGLYIPAFEAIAAKAEWWYYRDVRMCLGLAPYFVILAEALLALPLPWMVQRLRSGKLLPALGWGAVEGLIIWAATAVGLMLVG